MQVAAVARQFGVAEYDAWVLLQAAEGNGGTVEDAFSRRQQEGAVDPLVEFAHAHPDVFGGTWGSNDGPNIHIKIGVVSDTLLAEAEAQTPS